MKKLDKYLGKFKKGIFFEAFNLTKQNQKPFFLGLLFDVCFWIGALILATLTKAIAYPVVQSQNILAIFLLMVIYLLVLALLYSFTKYYALGIVKKLFRKSKFRIEETKGFYLLNLLCGLIIIISAGIISRFVMIAVRMTLLKWTTLVMTILLFALVFVFVGITHSLFAVTPNVKATLKKCFKLTFTRINKYYGILITNGVILVVFYLIYYLVAVLLNKLFELNFDRYNNLFIGVTVLLLLLLHSYNRIYFYLVVKRTKN